MATTHALVGMAAGAMLAGLVPDHAPAIMLSGFLAGVVPDLDVYADHRRTLHAPVYGPAVAVVALGVAVLFPSVWTVALAATTVAIALHGIMDIGDGGLSLEPWAEDPDRAVYSRYHGRWFEPRGYVRYDGAPEDLLVALAVGGPLFGLTTGPLQSLVAGTLLCSAVYVLLRKRLVAFATICIGLVPESLLGIVPKRFEELVEAD